MAASDPSRSTPSLRPSATADDDDLEEGLDEDKDDTGRLLPLLPRRLLPLQGRDPLFAPLLSKGSTDDAAKLPPVLGREPGRLKLPNPPPPPAPPPVVVVVMAAAAEEEEDWKRKLEVEEDGDEEEARLSAVGGRITPSSLARLLASPNCG